MCQILVWNFRHFFAFSELSLLTLFSLVLEGVLQLITSLLGVLGRAAIEPSAKFPQSRKGPLQGQWLNAPTRAFTFKNLSRHFAKNRL